MVVQSLGQPLRGPSSAQGPWLTGIVGLFYVPWPSYSYLTSRVSVGGTGFALDVLGTDADSLDVDTRFVPETIHLW